MIVKSRGWDSQLGFIAAGKKALEEVMCVSPRLRGRMRLRSREPELSFRISWLGVLGEERAWRVWLSWAW